MSVVKLDQENITLQKNLLDSKMIHSKSIGESETRSLDVIISFFELLVVK